jgi:predicted transposase YbfD/YdcC
MTNISTFSESLKSVPDTRKPQGIRYKLHNLLTIMVLAMLSGCDDFESMALFCKTKSSFLCEYGLLDGKNYPSHDLFRLLLMRLDKKIFGNLLVAWLETMELPHNGDLAKEQKAIHVDGKVIRATRTSEHSKTGLLVLNAYCSNTSITIGQELLEKKSCEKKAIPSFLTGLYLRDAVVTIDAIATMTHVAAIIIAKEGDYILALKKNNKHFFNEVADFFKHFPGTPIVSDCSQTIDKQGLRTDVRTCSIITDLRFFSDACHWAGLKTLVEIRSQRTLNGETTTELRYYLSSLDHTASSLMSAIRRHWQVENKLHWHLDVAFNEDKSRLRERNAALCLAMLRKFALTLLKKSSSKESIKTQRLALAWDEQQLLNLLNLLNFNNLQIC